MRASLCVALVVGACGSPPPSVDPPIASPPVVEAPPPPPPPPPPPSPTVIQDGANVATIVDGEVDECVEVSQTVIVPPGIDWRPPPLPDLAGDEPATGRDGRTIMGIERLCTEQFPGRTVMGRCTMGADVPIDGAPDGVTARRTAIAYSYRFGTALASDSRMLACMRDGGTWDGLPEDSHEYHAADAEYRLEEARELLGRRRR